MMTQTHDTSEAAPPSSKRWFRADVQGLRAIAVLGVVLFHAGLPLPGGYVGVDVFFVISGFVIGGLLLRELTSTNAFSPRTFFLRRARRLLPAAACMTVLTVALSAVLLSPLGGVQQAAGQAASAASVFLANAYFFLFTGGYFEPNATSNPFLHTWSLSVEEQFYLVLPWLLVAGWLLFKRHRQKALTSLILGGWVVSMVANLVFTYSLIPSAVPLLGPALAEYPEQATTFAFFSPLTRSWEFLTGVVVVLIGGRLRPKREIAILLGWGGLALIVGSFLFMVQPPRFPGLLAVIPVAGAAAVLLAGHSATPTTATSLLSNRGIRHLGDLSYSWYLWHWPLIVFALTWFDSMLASVCAAMLSYFVAWLSYRFLERPIHQRRWLLTDKRMALTAVLLILVPFLSGVALVQAWNQGWWSTSVKTLQETTTRPHLDTTQGCADISGIGPGSESCVFETPNAKGTVLLVGDSSAGMYVEPLMKAAHDLGYSLEVGTRNGCPIQVGGISPSRACEAFVNNTLTGVSRRDPAYSAIIVVNAGKYALSGHAFAPLATPGPKGANPQGFAMAVAKAADELARTSPVIVIYPIPQASGGQFPDCIQPSITLPPKFDCAQFTDDFIATTRTPTVVALGQHLARRATTYDPGTILCAEDGSCSMLLDGILVYRDESHLSVEGSMAFTADLRAALRQALRKPT